MLKQRFIFAVSLFAILAVGNVWADTASGDAVKTVHDVYEDLDTDETGIAGVSYVNKMVNAAGAAAQDAENHAASAGASALSAAAAASAAQTAADNAQTTANNVANKQDKSTAAYQMGNASGGWTAMTTAQQNALNSGITSTKVETYDAYAADKEAVANKLTSTATTTISDTNKDTLYPTVGKVQAMVNALDVSDTAESGKYVSAVSETDGKITVSRASLPTVGNATLTIQRNGTTVDKFTANATSDKTINIIDNDTTYSTGTATASGLTKLYTTTGTATDGTMTQAALNTALSGKQATIDDLGTIRTGAAAGATAVQPSAISDMQTKTNMKNAITDGMDKENTYPTVALLEAQIDSSAQETGQAISDINAALSGKQATLTTSNIKGAGSVSVGIENGVITVTGTDNDTKYTLPDATTTTKGGVIVGSNISVSSGTISVATGTPSSLGVVKVGQIPSGSATSTTYASIWVE